jgi:hypothetical protein
MTRQQRWEERHREAHLFARMMRGPSVKQQGKGAEHCVVRWGPVFAACSRNTLESTMAGLWDRRAKLCGLLGQRVDKRFQGGEVEFIGSLGGVGSVVIGESLDHFDHPAITAKGLPSGHEFVILRPSCPFAFRLTGEPMGAAF